MFRLLLLFLFISIAKSSTLKVPYQHFYRSSNADDAYVTKSGCSVVTWRGSDPYGVVSYPGVTRIECKQNATFRSDGVLADGHVRFYLQNGVMDINNETLDTMGESYWSQIGSRVKFVLRGAVLAIGGSLPTQAAVESGFSSMSYDAPIQRIYKARLAEIRHDEHIIGVGVAKDMTWSSLTRVDPPSIVVLNCNPGRSNVSEHFHPAGAIYAPFTGKICFVTTTSTDCIVPGEVRWTSPLLRYFEYFETPDIENAEARELLASVNESDICDEHTNPVVFAVTNFDPDDIAGQPNFDDYPSKTMTVRSTTVNAYRIEVTDDDEL